ncbi:MAG: putative toxin-antitoxin system toxin component, PIN family [Candidatus Latescibacteria bacterium]|nr:putative toxin-antitoxin system toxin component, PIN family [Candidatus Latescibacterota bacterium]
MRIVLDTNILVLSFIGDPADSIVRAALVDDPAGPLNFYSGATFAEYESVLDELKVENPRIFTQERVADVLNLIKQHGEQVYPALTLDACSHEPDNRFLECAVAADADYIVTVNSRHFPSLYQGVEIISPRLFYRMLFE